MIVSATVETWPVAGSFVIARGAKTEVAVVVATISDGNVTGRGEATPIYYHGETAESCAAQVRDWGGVQLNRIPELVEGLLSSFSSSSNSPKKKGSPSTSSGIRKGSVGFASLQNALSALTRGAARNALDAALWDFEAKRSGVPAWQRAGLSEPRPVESAITISLDTPEVMRARAAEKAALGHCLIKLKLSGDGDLERVAAVREGAPLARLVVDANEAWTGLDVATMAAGLLPYGVELIEQPVKAGEDHLLDGVVSPIPLCADESCQDRADLTRCIGRYQAINIKLDKAGGLTEALALATEARAAGLKLMVGCMLSTSLGIAPALLLAQQADWVDVDGPLLLAQDREGGVRFSRGMIEPPASDFWG
jgi:L-Ala-D/L-Glu epimerase